MKRSLHSDEKELVKSCLQGNNDAQKRLYNQCKGKMMALCLRYARNPEEAQDIMQDGFIRVFNKLHTYSGKGSLEGWIRRVIVNVAIRQYQKNSRIHIQADLEEAHNYADEEVTLKNIHAEELMEIIRKLPDGYRMVFNMYAIEGFAHKEIAEKLGISEGTSKSQLARARAWLQKRLKKMERISHQNVGR